MNTGMRAVNRSEPSDTYRVTAIAAMATTPARSAGQNASTAMTPIVVAMPLPPLKRNQIGQLWPVIAAAPQRIGVQI